MELWIRSQDKKILERCEDLFSAYYSSKKSYAICSHKNMVTLGLYKSEERALEVLDEIQSILQPRIITHEPVIDYDDMIHSFSENVAIHCTQQIETELKQVGQVVYQMPNE